MFDTELSSEMKVKLEPRIEVVVLQVGSKTWRETAFRSVQDDATRSNPDRGRHDTPVHDLPLAAANLLYTRVIRTSSEVSNAL